MTGSEDNEQRGKLRNSSFLNIRFPPHGPEPLTSYTTKNVESSEVKSNYTESNNKVNL